MSKDRTILRFAVVGLGVPAVWGVYQMLANPSPWSPLGRLSSVIFVILCPLCLLTFPLVDADVSDWGNYAIWTVIACLNAALYAGLGAAYVRKQKKREGEATN